MQLQGQTAIVTGGAIRIGRAIGRQLAYNGINVCVHYGSSEADAKAAVEEFKQLGVQASSVSADLSDPVSAAEVIMDHAQSEFGEVTILVNSAAIFEPGSLATTSEADWDRHLNINLKAPLFLSQRFAAALGKNRGSIVNIVDWRGERPVPGQLSYTISKAGLLAQTKILAQELGPQVRVNSVAPGAILPAPGESQTDFELKSRLNPLAMVSNPDEIAKAVLYLLQTEFVTGEMIHVTGGQQLQVPS